MIDGRYVVLAADDEAELLDALELFFCKENITMIKAYDGVQALNLFKEKEPDLVILDIMMPAMDGFSVLRHIRELSKVPAIMVTARTEDYDKILGLELGADDYITKPYNPLEVMARVKAQLRRNYNYKEEKKLDSNILKVRDILLNIDEGIVSKAGQNIVLTKTELKILELLMTKPGRIYTKQQIFNYIWEDPYMGDDSTIMVHISNLRNKIEDEPKKPTLIKTVKGLGYKLEKE